MTEDVFFCCLWETLCVSHNSVNTVLLTAFVVSFAWNSVENGGKIMKNKQSQSGK